jgi:hypothetical protein
MRVRWAPVRSPDPGAGQLTTLSRIEAERACTMSVTAPASGTIRLHRLTMVAEDDGVMVGRPDIGSYAVFPVEGAEALRMLDAGTPVSEVAAWYQETCGSALDVDDFLEVLGDLQFVRGDGEEAPQAPVRWQRLGRLAFSWPAMTCYAVITLAACVAMARFPYLRPTYRHLFFTKYLSLIPVAMAAATIPLVLLHESFHALAGRRLGLPSTLTIGRRFYYLVGETRLDSLFSVPKRKRYLPFLAGTIIDIVVLSALTLIAGILHSQGSPGWSYGFCLAIAFALVLRLIWQVQFYLETDFYFVISHAMRCPDLHQAAKFHVKTRAFRLLHRPLPQSDAEWSDRDQAFARWYAPLLIIGYGFSLFTLLWAGIPSLIRFTELLIGRFTGSHNPKGGILDALVFAVLMSLQWGLFLYVVVRDRRARIRVRTSQAPAGQATAQQSTTTQGATA